MINLIKFYRCTELTRSSYVQTPLIYVKCLGILKSIMEQSLKLRATKINIMLGRYLVEDVYIMMSWNKHENQHALTLKSSDKNIHVRQIVRIQALNFKAMKPVSILI